MKRARGARWAVVGLSDIYFEYVGPPIQWERLDNGYMTLDDLDLSQFHEGNMRASGVVHSRVVRPRRYGVPRGPG